MKWDEVQRAILEFKRKRPVSQEDLDALTKKQRRENISKHPFIVAQHFHKRVGKVFNFLKTSQSLGKYKVVDYFYRVEFQMRGIFYYNILFLIYRTLQKNTFYSKVTNIVY